MECLAREDIFPWDIPVRDLKFRETVELHKQPTRECLERVRCVMGLVTFSSNVRHSIQGSRR
jgi:hypothetical protein